MAEIDDEKLMTPQMISTLLEDAYHEGGAHMSVAFEDRNGGGGPKFAESKSAVWVGLYRSAASPVHLRRRIEQMTREAEDMKNLNAGLEGHNARLTAEIARLHAAKAAPAVGATTEKEA